LSILLKSASTTTTGVGGIEVTPVGFIEITAGETRYVSLDERQRIVKTLCGGED
jgi:uncharacterized spore protein YtfJ